MQVPARILIALVSMFSYIHSAQVHKKKPVLTPMQQVAKAHHWSAAQVADEWLVLYRESGSTPKHLNMWATNGHCLGSGQLSYEENGSYLDAAAVYEHFGGNYYTAFGQLSADANYDSQRYGNDPAQAWDHELEYGWY